GGAPRPPRAGSPERMGKGARLMTGTGSGREPNWDDLAAPIAPTPPWRTEGQRQAEEPDPGRAGRASPGQAPIQPLSGSPAATSATTQDGDAAAATMSRRGAQAPSTYSSVLEAITLTARVTASVISGRRLMAGIPHGKTGPHDRCWWMQ